MEGFTKVIWYSFGKCQSIEVQVFDGIKSVPIRSFFWSFFSRARSEYGDLQRKSLHYFRIRENSNPKNYSGFFHARFIFRKLTCLWWSIYDEEYLWLSRKSTSKYLKLPLLDIFANDDPNKLKTENKTNENSGYLNY